MLPKVGLALGAGGARGFAHIGVLKAFKKAEIPIDYIAGSSMGALVGALYCSGHTLTTIERMANIFKRKYYLDFTVPRMGFISGNKVKELVQLITHGKKIEELSPPLSIVATDLIKGEKVVYQEGLISTAVRASISIPGIFVPERIGNRVLVDGGVIDRVPVSVVKQMGADIVIAVDVSTVKSDPNLTSIFDVILQSIDIMQQEMVRFNEIKADVMIRPLVKQYSSKAFTNINEIIESGELEATQKIAAVRESIAKWKE